MRELRLALKRNRAIEHIQADEERNICLVDTNSREAALNTPSPATPKPKVLKASILLGHRDHGAPTQRAQRDEGFAVRWIVLGALTSSPADVCEHVT
jgi:hypothetical protein